MSEIRFDHELNKRTRLSREWKVKYDLVDNDEDDTLEYSYKNIFIYNPAKNGPGLTGDEIITIAHPLILAMSLTVNVDRHEILPLVNNAIKGVFPQMENIIWKGRVMDLLVDGLPIDCRAETFEVAGACSEFGSGEYTAIQPVNETFFKFSLLSGVSDVRVSASAIFDMLNISDERNGHGPLHCSARLEGPSRFGSRAEVQR